MSRTSHRGVFTCSICGETYVHTNFMVRRGRLEYAKDGMHITTTYRTDTHVMGCLKRHGIAFTFTPDHRPRVH